MSIPSRKDLQEWLRARGPLTFGVITPEYRRGYLHALDDLYRWMEYGGTPPTVPPRERDGAP